MKIAVLGATGRTGSELVTQALAAEHEVVAYVRHPEAMDPKPGLTIVGGQLDDKAALAKALTGCHAVAITLGPKISRPNAPIMQVAIPETIAAAKEAEVGRIIVLSALGVGNTYQNTRYPYRFGCRTFLRGNFEDHLAGESQLMDSGLDWTTIHPGPLSNGPRTPHPTIVEATPDYKMPGSPRTMRADVAAAMLNMINDESTFGKQMLITSARQSA